VTPINLAATNPTEGLGGHEVVLDALNYIRGNSATIVPSGGAYPNSSTLTSSQLPALVPTTPYSVSGSVILPNGLAGKLDSGVVLISHGGMITMALPAASQMANGGPYSVSDLPGGFACAFYGVEGFGWLAANPGAQRAISVPAVADLRTGNATNVDLTMIPLF
jgi:hypothetical protein